MACKEFEDRILTVLLPEFCSDTSQGWGPEGFRNECNKIHDQDAKDFLRGLDAGLIKHVDHGHYLSPKSSAKEQFFWSGSKKINPRVITIWVEPIITVAVLTRLHFNLGWPENLIGTQSPDWAFDVVTYQKAHFDNEYIACEIKKSASELAQLVEYMHRFGGNPQLDRPSKAKELNAYKKIVGLRQRRAPLFWAVGPNNENYVFSVTYGEDGLVKFKEVTIQALQYSDCAALPDLHAAASQQA